MKKKSPAAKKKSLTLLGNNKAKFKKLETFPSPSHCEVVRCITDEITAICPVTGQPDLYTIEISYLPALLCVESKSLKLYLQNFRNQGHFCEQFADIICNDIFQALKPLKVEVTVAQKPRGGIAIISSSVMGDLSI